MQTFQMMALGSMAEVEVGYCAQFRWDDGTVEYMTRPDKQWSGFGISESDRDKIKTAQSQYKAANRSCQCGSGEPWSKCSANSQYCG